MKLHLILLLLFCVTVSSCEDDMVYESTGQILGLDLALCPCCGSWLIQIEGESDGPYQFIELPEDSDIDLSNPDDFPIDVQLNWEPTTTGCTNHIVIESIDIL